MITNFRRLTRTSTGATRRGRCPHRPQAAQQYENLKYTLIICLYCTRNKTVNNFIRSGRFPWRPERFSKLMVQTAIAFRPAPKKLTNLPLAQYR